MIRLGPYGIKADWGHLALATAFTAYMLWLLSDAKSVSRRFETTILILPGAILGVILFALILWYEIKIVRVEPAAAARPPRARRWWWPGLEAFRIPAFLALLGVYVFAMPVIGFDVATFLFMAAGLYLQGERRPLWAIGFPLVFALAVTWAFKSVLTVIMPTLLFGG